MVAMANWIEPYIDYVLPGLGSTDLRFEEPVDTRADLPLRPLEGQAHFVVDEDAVYVCIEGRWHLFSGSVLDPFDG
jgi:hypothetical protein